MMAFQNPCRGSTNALMYDKAAGLCVSWTKEYTRFVLEGSHVMRMAVKNRMEHLVYDHAALLSS